MPQADALRASHGQLPAVLQSRSSILIALDQDGQVLLWNRAAEQTFGIGEDQILGRPFLRCAIAWDWDRIASLAPDGISRQVQRIIQPFTRRDGSTGVVAMQVKPQFNSRNMVTGCLWLGSESVRPSSPRPSPAAVRQAGVPVQRTPVPEQDRRPEQHDAARLYPVHMAFLDSHLVSMGEDLAHWRIQHALESRLDEQGMEICFTLVRRYPAQGVLCCRILVASGELVSIREG